MKNEYQLIDSGDGEKLEQYGSIRLARPSSVCIWKKRLPSAEWKKADATFDAKNEKWVFKSKNFECWQMTQAGCLMELRLQTNGQVGLFPEHSFCLPQLAEAIEKIKAVEKQVKVLNLFAYTGMASVFCAQREAEVCHVDLSKKALTWVSRNLELNGIENNKVRLICDDALKFLEREVKRGNRYEIVIVDPPSFSRISKTQFWKLEDAIAELVSTCTKALNPEHHALLLTCHHPGLTCEMLANLLTDNPQTKADQIVRKEMGLEEVGSGRILSTGSMAFTATNR